jgi:hypothetical protein
MPEIHPLTRHLGTRRVGYDGPLARPLREQHGANEHPSLFFRGLLFGVALAIPLWAAILTAFWWVLR